eukprot:m.189042 g.189042  ORF g.189042 m.189042 type:complete len:513 (-) comp25652_c0_seq2:188-1726(-)
MDGETRPLLGRVGINSIDTDPSSSFPSVVSGSQTQDEGYLAISSSLTQRLGRANSLGAQSIGSEFGPTIERRPSMELPPCPRYLGVLFFLCGVSTFARTESFLLQTVLFSMCFDYGPNYYPIASGCLFLPGIFVQLLQSRFDMTFGRQLSTFKANLLRISVSAIGSAVIMGLYMFCIHTHANLRHSPAFLYPVLVLLGVLTSIGFGSFNQVASLFSGPVYSAYFVGTMCPFFVFAPLNVGIGNLCSPSSCNQTSFDIPCGSDPPNNSLPEHLVHPYQNLSHHHMPKHWSAHWSSLEIYYSLAATLTLSGFFAFLFLGRIQHTLSLFALKDADHVEDVTLAKPTERAKLSFGRVLCRIWKPATTQAITTIASTVVASQYINFIPSRFHNLPTLLIYEYYIMSSLGIAATLHSSVSLLSSNVFLGISIVRLVFIPATVLYVLNEMSFNNDWVILGCNCVFMFVGGMCFSLSFTQASAMFKEESVRSLASSVMTAVYYCSLCVGIGGTFLLNSYS